ncbi:hypothetical protein [Streptomyces sp. NPDC059460]|uniref:hypothetical protein n=1 Tax=Streptomyces sp. NPDC059460 TaxID=3346840 RepID=UPI00369A6CE2
MAWQPELVRGVDAAGKPAASLGHAVVDDYLEFVAARCRPNTLLATAYDLKVFFSAVPKEPTDVVTADVFAFITAQKKETVSSPAPVPGSIVPPWREGLPVTVLAPDYQRILGVLDERQPAGQGPLRAKEITVQLGLETTSAKVEGVRSKARRLAERGWLVQETSGMFSVGRRPVPAPDAGPSA